ncbi:MAG: hypothetical protein C4531_15020 [Desulfurivibrio sp.]|nr:MAG: hypothetical protein C4531_15020 [Desulfurivibrio sp.]
MIMPERIECRVRFVTPAFLGNAEQKGQWRTPPFKALLRQWWRVAAAREHGYNHARLREAEGLLLGHAWLKEPGSRNKTWAMQGQVRLRLDEWRDGQLNRWPGNEPQVRHEEVGVNGRNVGAHLYLGYGPLTYQKNVGTALKSSPAINANDAASLRLGVPSQHQAVIINALNLIHWFGNAGGRSRNGWGSIALEGIANYTPPSVDDLISGGVLPQLAGFARPLANCLKLDWPHALGRNPDGSLLLWKSRNHFSDWSQAMRELARVKIAFRTVCSIKRNQDMEENGICNPCFDDRHLLAYPVTHHGVDGWVEKNERSGQFKRDRRGEYLIQSERLANQLRFKVVKDSRNHYWCLAYHLPCGLPEMLQQKRGHNRTDDETQLRVWQKVHNRLNTEMQCITQGGRP